MSRDLFDMFVGNPRDGLIIADFAVQGTLARSVLDSPKEVLTRDGHKVLPFFGPRISFCLLIDEAAIAFLNYAQAVAFLEPPTNCCISSFEQEAAF